MTTTLQWHSVSVSIALTQGIEYTIAVDYASAGNAAWDMYYGADQGGIRSSVESTFAGLPATWTEVGGYQAPISMYAEVDEGGATAPAQITDLSASPGDTEVALSWTTPNDGGSAITDYEYRVDGGTWASTGSATPGYTVTGLTNGVSYDFEVRAINAVGGGPASNLVSATPTAPTVPTQVPDRRR